MRSLRAKPFIVIPAKAGIPLPRSQQQEGRSGISAFAGMTGLGLGIAPPNMLLAILAFRGYQRASRRGFFGGMREKQGFPCRRRLACSRTIVKRKGI